MCVRSINSCTAHASKPEASCWTLTEWHLVGKTPRWRNKSFCASCSARGRLQSSSPVFDRCICYHAVAQWGKGGHSALGARPERGAAWGQTKMTNASAFRRSNSSEPGSKQPCLLSRSLRGAPTMLQSSWSREENQQAVEEVEVPKQLSFSPYPSFLPRLPLLSRLQRGRLFAFRPIEQQASESASNCDSLQSHFILLPVPCVSVALLSQCHSCSFGDSSLQRRRNRDASEIETPLPPPPPGQPSPGGGCL